MSIQPPWPSGSTNSNSKLNNQKLHDNNPSVVSSGKRNSTVSVGSTAREPCGGGTHEGYDVGLLYMHSTSVPENTPWEALLLLPREVAVPSSFLHTGAYHEKTNHARGSP